MCLETDLVLLGSSAEAKLAPTDELAASNEPIFEFKYSDLIGGLRAGFRGQGEDESLNAKLSRYLIYSLAHKLRRSQWKLELKFSISTFPAAPGVDLVGPVDILVESAMLEKLKSIMTCGDPRHRLKLRLRAKLVAVSRFSIVGINIGDVDLDDEDDGGTKSSSQVRPENCRRKRIKLDEVMYWELSSIRLEAVITGPVCPFTARGLQNYVSMLDKDFLTIEGKFDDLRILAKGNKLIPCHKSVVSAESPVLDRVLRGNSMTAFYAVIRMSDRTPEQVLSFLSFLYHANKGMIGTEKALQDPSLTLALLEMAQLYDVQWLVTRMKEFLLKIGVQKFSAETALRLIGFTSGKSFKDRELKLKGFEALKLRSRKEILKSKTFKEVFPTAMQRELYLGSRQRF